MQEDSTVNTTNYIILHGDLYIVHRHYSGLRQAITWVFRHDLLSHVASSGINYLKCIERQAVDMGVRRGHFPMECLDFANILLSVLIML